VEFSRKTVPLVLKHKNEQDSNNQQQENNDASKIIPDSFYFIHGPVFCEDKDLVDHFKAQIIQGREENIRKGLQEVPDVELLLVIADTAEKNLHIGTDLTNIFEYLYKKVVEHDTTVKLDPGSQRMYEYMKMQLYKQVVQKAKEIEKDGQKE
jgi:hypothetical protein